MLRVIRVGGGEQYVETTPRYLRTVPPITSRINHVRHCARRGSDERDAFTY